MNYAERQRREMATRQRKLETYRERKQSEIKPCMSCGRESAKVDMDGEAWLCSTMCVNAWKKRVA